MLIFTLMGVPYHFLPLFVITIIIMVYNAVQPQLTDCPTCRIFLEHVTSRPCPNTQVIRKHLQESAGFEGTLEAGNKVYYSGNSHTQATVTAKCSTFFSF